MPCSLRRLLLALSLLLPPLAWAATPGATIALPAKATWHRLTDLGLLLVGTPEALLLINGETGQIQWQRDDIKKTQAYNVRAVEGSPIILVNDWSGAFEAKVSSQGLNVATGETVFRTEPEKGQNLGLFPTPDGRAVLNLSQLWLPEQGVFATLYDTASGTQIWRTRIAKPSGIQTFMADGSGAFSARMDLSGHQDPLFTPDTVYLPYAGLMALDLKTGAQKWDLPYKTADQNLKRAYATPVIEGDTIFASGKGAVYAIDLANGTQRWKSDKVASGMFSSAAISQVLPAGDTVYVRLGGNFYNQGTKAFELKEPLGVLALDRATGKKKWEYKKAKDGITNLLLLPGAGVVMLSDAHELLGIDMAASGKATPKFEVPLDFKSDMSGGEMAAAGISTVSGLLTGGLAGAMKGGMGAANNKNRLDVPVALLPRGDNVLVAGKRHLLLFDPKAQKTLWSVDYPAPKNSGLGLAMMSALTLAAATVHMSTQASTTSFTSIDQARSMNEQAFGSLNDYATRRFEATQRTRDTIYVLTEITEGSTSGAGIRAISPVDGQPRGQVMLGDKEPEYAVDEIDGRLYYLDDDKQVLVYTFQ